MKAEHLLTAMDDANEHVRVHAIKLSERFLEGKVVAAGLVKKLGEMVADPSMIVRYQLAFTLGYLRDGELAARLAKIAAKDGGDGWVAAAVLDEFGGRSGDRFVPNVESAPSCAMRRERRRCRRGWRRNHRGAGAWG